MMTYKKYSASVEFDDKGDVFHGEVMGIRDVVTFEGASVKEIRKAFKDSVDDYLAFCEERGEKPEKPFSGKFIVRSTPQLHKQISLSAKKEGKSLNTWIITHLAEDCEA